MKRVWITTVLLSCAAAWTANAQEADGRKGLSEEQAKQRQSLIEKYDADGDGVLSKSEQKTLSKADKQALAKTGGVGTARKAPRVDTDSRDKGSGHDRNDRDATKAAKSAGGGKGKSDKK